MKNYIIIGLIFLIVIFGVSLAVKGGDENQANLSGFFTSTVTNTTSSVSNVSTNIVTSTANLQYLELTGDDVDVVSCAFGATAIKDTGVRINPIGSSSLTVRIITDQNLLQKGVNCIGTATSTLGVLKY